MRAQPVKQICVLSGGEIARQGLVKMMVSIDQTWQNHHPLRIERLICVLRELVRLADLSDLIINDIDAAICPLCIVIVHRDNQFSMLNK